jgi:hypothetical protein
MVRKEKREVIEAKSKWEEFKEAINNPPPERLAKIEYQSQFLLIGAYLLAGIMFIIKSNYWFIIPIFILSSLISYSQGMSAYNKYKVIKSFIPKETLEEINKDISFTRKRSKIIKLAFGEKVGWITAFTSVLFAVLIIDPTLSRWKLMFAYPIVIITFYFVIYFFILYWIATLKYPELHLAKLKGGKK